LELSTESWDYCLLMRRHTQLWKSIGDDVKWLAALLSTAGYVGSSLQEKHLGVRRYDEESSFWLFRFNLSLFCFQYFAHLIIPLMVFSLKFYARGFRLSTAKGVIWFNIMQPLIVYIYAQDYQPTHQCQVFFRHKRPPILFL
jgi:hypothetical protein